MRPLTAALLYCFSRATAACSSRMPEGPQPAIPQLFKLPLPLLRLPREWQTPRQKTETETTTPLTFPPPSPLPSLSSPPPQEVWGGRGSTDSLTAALSLWMPCLELRETSPIVTWGWMPAWRRCGPYRCKSASGLKCQQVIMYSKATVHTLCRCCAGAQAGSSACTVGLKGMYGRSRASCS